MPSLVTPAIPVGRLRALSQPVIGAGDLLLRPWQAADAPAVVAAFADPAIQRWHARTMTPDEAAEWIARWPRRWSAETDAGWAVALASSGAAIGQVSLRNLDLVEGCSSISYWTLPAARGRGVAVRALTAMSGWAFSELKLHRLQLRHATANQASCRVAVKAGYAAEGVNRSSALHADGWHDMHQHARLDSD